MPNTKLTCPKCLSPDTIERMNEVAERADGSETSIVEVRKCLICQYEYQIKHPLVRKPKKD